MLNDNLVIGAFRYYLGRQTYAVSDFCLYIQDNLDHISEYAIRVIRRELREEIERDDEARIVSRQVDVSESRFLPLGADCDKVVWVELFKRLKEYDYVP